jgi:hypothetical protein
MALSDPPVPSHIWGTPRGEERARKGGVEPGRREKGSRDYRTARDSTSINAEHHGPIDPRMPNIPPA